MSICRINPPRYQSNAIPNINLTNCPRKSILDLELESIFPLQIKVESFKNTIKRLEILFDAKEHPKKHLFKSLIASAILASLIAGAVLGSYFFFTINSFAASIGVPIILAAAWLTSYGLGAFYNYTWGDPGKVWSYADPPGGTIPSFGYVDPIILPIAGIFIPVCKTLANIFYSNEKYEEKNQKINVLFQEIKQNILEVSGLLQEKLDAMEDEEKQAQLIQIQNELNKISQFFT